MLFRKKENLQEDQDQELAERVAAEAERFYRSGKMHCAEAVLASVKNAFAPALPDDLVRLASGFGGGSGAGCICGAISGGTMALGLVCAERKRVAALTKELHQWFQEQYGVTCCKTLTANGKKKCVTFTASVAGKVAEMLQREA